jgi:hypothetical protein
LRWLESMMIASGDAVGWYRRPPDKVEAEYYIGIRIVQHIDRTKQAVGETQDAPSCYTFEGMSTL